MRTTWKAALVVIGGIVGCAAGASGDDGNGTEQPPGSDTASDSGAGSDTGNSSSRDASDSSTAAPCTDASDCQEQAGPPTPERNTKTCVAGANAHSSRSTVSYDPNGGAFSITGLETLVKNSLQRNGNFLVVAVKTKAGANYVDLASSGPILTSGVSVPVPLPANVTLQAGDTIRVTTTFDEGSALDPFAPCFIKF